MNGFPEISQLAPLKFEPIYQERIWGGKLLNCLPHRAVPQDRKIGESWELADRPEANVQVASGALQGRTLSELVAHYGRRLLGAKAPNTDRFPLLVKLIDAGDRLSLQVHPDQGACARIGGGAEPKTEMWYIIKAQPEAKILAGLNSRATRQQLIESLKSPEVEALMQVYKSEPGDAYFISAGTVHAIGGGNLILEIQQNSDTTYRLSDWGRVDAQGNSRRLDIEKGISAINFFNRSSPHIAGVHGKVDHNRKFEVISMCPFFKVDELHIRENWSDDTAPDKSFHLLTAINAPVLVRQSAGVREARADVGESLLLPAEFGGYEIVPESATETLVVKTRL